MALISTDLVSAIASTGLSGRQVICSSNELAVMQPAGGMTCGEYLQPYATAAGGKIYNPNATANCEYCSASNADQFLSSVAISYSTRWRDYGIGFAYIVFNIFMAVVLYYLIRVRKGSGKGIAERFSPLLAIFKKDPLKENKGDEKKKGPQAKGESVLP
jgi:ABC-type multidrug transport system permease subunit